VSTAQSQKISIILVLSITIIAVVLITGTVVNIVSAANSIKVQTKTNPVTSTGSRHTVSRNLVQAQGKHVSFTACVEQRSCPTEFTDMYIRESHDPSLHNSFDYGGKLLGCQGLKSGANVCSTDAGWYGIDKAPIEIKVKLGRDGHGLYTLPYLRQTNDLAMFAGTFSLCDAPAATNHDAYLTAYGHPVVYDDQGFLSGTFPGSKYPGPYQVPIQSTGNPGTTWFKLPVCGTTHAHK
jgi:hypothetical protein